MLYSINTDVSTSFKRLQEEKLAADVVLCDLTPLTSIQDATALKQYFKSLNSKSNVRYPNRLPP